MTNFLLAALARKKMITFFSLARLPVRHEYIRRESEQSLACRLTKADKPKSDAKMRYRHYTQALVEMQPVVRINLVFSRNSEFLYSQGLECPLL